MSEKIDLKKRVDLLRYNKQLLFRWVRRNQTGRSVSRFFLENRLKKIAFFYWNELSELLYYELKDTNIQSDVIEDTSIIGINIENTNIGNAHKRINPEQAITENEAELLDIYRSLSCRDRHELMSMVYKMQDKAKA